MSRSPVPSLQGRVVVITRPAGTGAGLARRVRALGGRPLLLPGLSLQAVDDATTRAALARALRAPAVIFTSPAAVRFAAALVPIPADCAAIGVGQGTARALRRTGVTDPQSPARQDSEGVLALPALQSPAGRAVALVGAAGGRGLLRATLRARGARLDEVHVYARGAPRLDRRHVKAVLALPADARVLLSSVEALHHLARQLPPEAWAVLQRGVAVVSSERLGEAARAAGFTRLAQARSAGGADLLAAAAGGFTQP
ncbi:MAG TPA: uroporphyrinogen-III synthase [Dyella sp.]|nr:uroporphyrinogen-III synthase [Dyella sp.]